MPQRKKHQIERDLARISELHLQGKLQWEIAAEIGISQQQVSCDLRKLEKRWKETQHRNTDEAMGRRIATVRFIQKEYFEGWQRSIQAKTKRATERNTGGTAAQQRERTSVQTENMIGDPRMLAGALDCEKEVAKLEGVYVDKHAFTDPTGTAPAEPVSEEERMARIMAILERARERRDRELELASLDRSLAPE